MIWDVGVHRTDDQEVVRAFGDVGKEVANVEATLAVFRKGERGTEGRAGGALCFEVACGEWFAVESGEFGFGVEGVDVGRAAVGKKMDDAFGPGWELRGAGDHGGGCSEHGLGGLGEAC